MSSTTQSSRTSFQPALEHHTSREWQLSRSVKAPAVLLIIAFFSFLWLDFAVSHHFVSTGRLPGDIAKLFEAAEHFGTLWGQFLILWVVIVFDRRHAYRLPRIATAATLGGLATDLFKLGISRVRPKYFDFAGLGIADSFTGWFNLGAGGSNFQSFPSGHTASAVAFAVALGWAYPQGRAMFLTMAGLVAVQRVETASHFVSDTLVGAAIGWMVGSWIVEDTPSGRWWTNLESHWRKQPASNMSQRIQSQSDVSRFGHETSLLDHETVLPAHGEPPVRHGVQPAFNKAVTSA